ncbi:hypothetical protein SAMN02745866_03153 [Alteromonadaceae bacterium Bs31]|nr:hypothetical protein SAMN02745866_03153 [Alteromonadaceae bacterium Bs31]
MPNDKGWQRRTDEWVKAMHLSRLQKEQSKEENIKNVSMGLQNLTQENVRQTPLHHHKNNP